MKKSDDPKIKLVNWFLDFVAVDLDTMSKIDFAKLWLEANYYFRVRWFLKDDLDGYLEMSTGSKSGNINISNLEDEPEDKLDIKKDFLKVIQKELKEIVEKILVSHDSYLKKPPPKRQAWEKLAVVGTVDVELIVDNNYMLLNYIPATPFIGEKFNIERYTLLAKISFCDSLHGLPGNSIKSCKECGRYFLHLSKKPKYYCSPKCGSRYLSREKRRSDPEGYKTKQREIMRKKYREKKAKELGKPVEKVKIQERVKKK